VTLQIDGITGALIMNTDRPVLIAYDGSKDARAAISVAGQLFPGSEAVVLYAREPLEAVAAHLEGHPALEDLRNSDAASLDASEKVAAEQARDAGLNAAPRVASTGQTAAEAIIEAAEALDAELIVVGSRGRRGLHAALLGSTSTTVLHRTGRPTLVVPPRGSAEPAR
jgi:nucleotide-binding universal stress UspA family protein